MGDEWKLKRVKTQTKCVWKSAKENFIKNVVCENVSAAVIQKSFHSHSQVREKAETLITQPEM